MIGKSTEHLMINKLISCNEWIGQELVLEFKLYPIVVGYASKQQLCLQYGKSINTATLHTCK